MKRISIEYFAVLRELSRKDREVLETSMDSAADLFAELQVRYGFPALTSVKVAINDEFADWHHPLRDGDSVVFIPPVAGG